MFQAAAWIVLGIFSLIRLEADYLLVVSKHCKHCWIHQVQQRYVVIEKFLVKIYCPSYFTPN
jgi:hypothetical protein